jgi:hypothetical protein
MKTQVKKVSDDGPGEQFFSTPSSEKVRISVSLVVVQNLGSDRDRFWS